MQIVQHRTEQRPRNLYLLFPVEAPGVTVGNVDVAVRLEDRQLQTPQDAVEQLAAGCLEKEQCRGRL